MKVHILDDWFDTLRSLPCFAKLADHEVTVWTDHEPDPVKLAARLQEAEALVLFRERTKVGADLLAGLPNLKLISQRSVYPHVDVPACTAHGVLLCSNMHSDTPSYAAAEHTLALILASYRQIPQQVTSIKAGRWQSGVGRTLRGRTLGLYGYGRIAGAVAGYAKALGLNVQWWGSEAGRARAAAAGETVAVSREAFFRESDIVSLHVRLNSATRGFDHRRGPCIDAATRFIREYVSFWTCGPRCLGGRGCEGSASCRCRCVRSRAAFRSRKYTSHTPECSGHAPYWLCDRG